MAARTTPDHPARRGASRVRTLTVAVVLAAVAVLAWRFWPRGTESTDDAFIEARIVAVAPTIAGRVVRVLVDDNQHVHAGDAIAELDAEPLRARVDEARAALALAEATRRVTGELAAMAKVSTGAAVDQATADLASARATLEQARAEAEAAAAAARQAEGDRERFAHLESGVTTPQEVERVTQAAAAARAQAEAARRKIAVEEAGVAVAQAKLAATGSGAHQVGAAEAGIERAAADVERARATVHEAEIALGYARIVAPIDGRVTRKSVETGAFVQAGQALLALVGDQVWVVANLKESQLRELKVGQHARVRVDAYPQEEFAAHVDSVQAGSGTRFSLLPPENATGNFVKVVQRVPVKLVFDTPPDPARFHLGPGMSAQPTISVR